MRTGGRDGTDWAIVTAVRRCKFIHPSRNQFTFIIHKNSKKLRIALVLQPLHYFTNILKSDAVRRSPRFKTPDRTFGRGIRIPVDLATVFKKASMRGSMYSISGPPCKGGVGKCFMALGAQSMLQLHVPGAGRTPQGKQLTVTISKWDNFCSPLLKKMKAKSRRPVNATIRPILEAQRGVMRHCAPLQTAHTTKTTNRRDSARVQMRTSALSVRGIPGHHPGVPVGMAYIRISSDSPQRAWAPAGAMAQALRPQICGVPSAFMHIVAAVRVGNL